MTDKQPEGVSQIQLNLRRQQQLHESQNQSVAERYRSLQSLHEATTPHHTFTPMQPESEPQPFYQANVREANDASQAQTHLQSIRARRERA